MTTPPADGRPAPVRLADCSPEQRRLVLLLIEAGRNHRVDVSMRRPGESPDGRAPGTNPGPARRLSDPKAAA